MAEVWYLDYANGWPSAAVARNQGYRGVIRYVTAPALMQPPNPGNRKHITEAEYQAYLAAGLDVWLVYQGGTTDAESGYAGGRTNALRALAGCQDASGRRGPVGYTGPIFFCNDRPELPNPTAWRAYLDGAASVLGIGRVGAYGFGNAMDAAKGHATWFWQAGRRADVRPHVHFWQDNNTQVTVGGVVCDRNLVVGDIRKDDIVADLTQQNLNDIAAAVWERQIWHLTDGTSNKAWVWLVGANMGAWDAADDQEAVIAAIRESSNTQTAQIMSALTGVATGNVDTVALATALADALGPDLAQDVANELHTRLGG